MEKNQWQLWEEDSLFSREDHPKGTGLGAPDPVVLSPVCNPVWTKSCELWKLFHFRNTEIAQHLGCFIFFFNFPFSSFLANMSLKTQFFFSWLISSPWVAAAQHGASSALWTGALGSTVQTKGSRETLWQNHWVCFILCIPSKAITYPSCKNIYKASDTRLQQRPCVTELLRPVFCCQR